MDRIKYPRTLHLPWSQGRTDDDKVLSGTSHFDGQDVVVTLKMDGENTTIYKDGTVHARSLDSRGGIDRDWVIAFAQTWCFNLPEGWRVCGENLWARHSIAYDDLKSYFYGFSIWNEKNECLSWKETLEWFELLGITPVQELAHGEFSMDMLKWVESVLRCDQDEGYVLRITDGFKYDDFQKSVAKYVRANHVQTEKHWRHSAITSNGVKPT